MRQLLHSPLQLLVIWLASAILGASVNADIITFEDKNVFLATTNASTATGPLPNLGTVGTPTIGDLTFSLGPQATLLHVGAMNVPFATGNDWSPRFPGNEIAITGREDLNVDIASSVFSIGFDFVEPEDDPNTGTFLESTFSVTLFAGALQVDTFSYSRPNDVASFVGVASNTPFNRIEIRETAGGVENEFFGEFFTGSIAVPEPTTSLVFVGAICCMVVKRRRNSP